MVDAVVERNRKMLLDRSTLGLAKYGAPLHDYTDERGILQHALEEALDLANYLQTRIMQIDGELPYNDGEQHEQATSALQAHARRCGQLP